MGSARLKKKNELRYRKYNKKIDGMHDGHHQYCGHCENYDPLFEVQSCAAFNAGVVETIRTEPRCKILGLKSSIKYRVRGDHTCDAWTFATE